MASEVKFLAFDLGAESGRGVVGFFDGTKVRLEDVHRFPNQPVRLLDTLYWDAPRLFHEMKQGLSRAVAMYGADIASLGVDCWGVDFGLLDRNDALVCNPRHYRDHGNDGILETAFSMVPRSQIFERTGIQFMQINTLFQLLVLKLQNSPQLETARTLLFMPDLFNLWFTGEKTTEFSIASTSQMIDPMQRAWAQDLLEAFNLPFSLLTDIVPTATKVGMLRPDIAAEVGCASLPIIAPGEHDTASAVVAVPASSTDYAYISSGTWSLMGIEMMQAVITEATQTYNFTNEGGACGTIRLLKNIMGLWLVQECRRDWARHGNEYTYDQLTEAASAATPFGAILEPDAAPFLAPSSMPEEIRRFCTDTAQTPPKTDGEMVRCCLESLALKYRWTLERLEEFRGRRIEVIHIVGGGTQNRLLCQLAADATNRPVIAGPREATAIGNVLMQALGCGYIASLEQAREVVRRSFELDTYQPTTERDGWEEAYARYLALREKIGKQD